MYQHIIALPLFSSVTNWTWFRKNIKCQRHTKFCSSQEERVKQNLRFFQEIDSFNTLNVPVFSSVFSINVVVHRIKQRIYTKNCYLSPIKNPLFGATGYLRNSNYTCSSIKEITKISTSGQAGWIQRLSVCVFFVRSLYQIKLSNTVHCNSNL